MTSREPTAPEADERIVAAKAILDENATMAIAACDGEEPWVSKVFFVEDEPASGSFDMCCCVLLTAARHEMLAAHPRVAFVVGRDEPQRWLSGIGRVELLDDADASAMIKRLEEKTPAAGAFLAGLPSTPVRIHVERLKVTDLRADPPVAEFTFA